MKLITLALFLVIGGVATKSSAGEDRLLRKREELDTDEPARESRAHVLLGQNAPQISNHSPLASIKRDADVTYIVEVIDPLLNNAAVALKTDPTLKKRLPATGFLLKVRPGQDKLKSKVKGTYVLHRKLDTGDYIIVLGKLPKGYILAENEHFNRQGILKTKITHQAGVFQVLTFKAEVTNNNVINLNDHSKGGPRIWLDKNKNGFRDENDISDDKNIITTIKLFVGKSNIPSMTVTRPVGPYDLTVRDNAVVEQLSKKGGSLVFEPPAGYDFTQHKQGGDHDPPSGFGVFELKIGLTIGYDESNNAPNIGLVTIADGDDDDDQTESPVETPTQPSTTSPPPGSSTTGTSPTGTNPTVAPPTGTNPTGPFPTASPSFGTPPE